jgi:hypothetical protein
VRKGEGVAAAAAAGLPGAAVVVAGCGRMRMVVLYMSVDAYCSGRLLG